jgi:hypothetical protein
MTFGGLTLVDTIGAGAFECVVSWGVDELGTPGYFTSCERRITDG